MTVGIPRSFLQRIAKPTEVENDGLTDESRQSGSGAASTTSLNTSYVQVTRTLKEAAAVTETNNNIPENEPSECLWQVKIEGHRENATTRDLEADFNEEALFCCPRD